VEEPQDGTEMFLTSFPLVFICGCQRTEILSSIRREVEMSLLSKAGAVAAISFDKKSDRRVAVQTF